MLLEMLYAQCYWVEEQTQGRSGIEEGPRAPVSTSQTAVCTRVTEEPVKCRLGFCRSGVEPEILHF